MKNEVFNGSRFATYFKYDLTQMWRNHMRAALGIGLSGLILYVLTLAYNLIINHIWAAPSLGARAAVLVVAFTILELYQTHTYGYLTDHKKGAAWLMIPASTFEKWLSMLIMTLVIIPIVFFLAYFAVDGLLCLLDPTCEAAVLSKFSDGMNILHLKLGEANDFYNTSWNTSIMILPVLGGYCTNFLFFLLCGLCFKRHKILGAFIVIFIVSLLASLVSSVFFSTDFANNFEDFSQAEAGIRAFVDTVSIVIWILAIGLGAGVFYRLKTLKH